MRGTVSVPTSLQVREEEGGSRRRRRSSSQLVVALDRVDLAAQDLRLHVQQPLLAPLLLQCPPQERLLVILAAGTVAAAGRRPPAAALLGAALRGQWHSGDEARRLSLTEASVALVLEAPVALGGPRERHRRVRPREVHVELPPK
eukprot:CAMPEP_0206416036 /NCGR_PEP_ID=MMETSP0294-20121207/36465_1 /ASSEMBLY_ACC=CAM_ASM_000327 /TAXON_ID=39354 /ORGANISM="Heterosigma akashiwo, Strain CCMP2393" /LENGTH=144 /DNA_ID=CAMNT_0053878529 /DNA_START=504 /DNA_END=938 /DNA_ORIENTATION=+